MRPQPATYKHLSYMGRACAEARAKVRKAHFDNTVSDKEFRRLCFISQRMRHQIRKVYQRFYCVTPTPFDVVGYN